MIWLVTVLKLSDYWIVAAGNQCFPAEWNYYLYTVDEMYQVLLYINQKLISPPTQIFTHIFVSEITGLYWIKLLNNNKLFCPY